ncbi:hypothetical protein V498_03643 [Pseudogymnoascus sp. VKM F-4517 (FW-2822)]|nr:hypothetical protein V498_03643 [Pseudogymnoascus sp. VKM F-4517 (FW-2822)]
MPKEFSITEVARHTARNDVFIVYNNRVYNVTPFISNHPGGEDIILQLAGKDATEAFDEVGHSKDAHDQLEELFVGVLNKKDITINSLSKPAQGNNKIRGRNGIFLYGLVAAAGSAVSYGVYSMRKN